METIRLTLVFFHVFIIIFIIINSHADLNTIFKASNYRTKIGASLVYIFTFLRITFYHSASIAAVWFSRQYGAGLVRASGILLIGELFQIITETIQRMLEVNHLLHGELYFLATFDLLLLTAMLLTFRLAEKVSQYQKNLMQIELLADTVHDDSNEPTIT